MPGFGVWAIIDDATGKIFLRVEWGNWGGWIPGKRAGIRSTWQQQVTLSLADCTEPVWQHRLPRVSLQSGMPLSSSGGGVELV